MPNLPSEKFQLTKQFIMENGRELDQHLFQYHFEAGSRDVVLESLAHFQNPDGGFGNALEPDIRAPASSVIATSTAFGVFKEIQAPGSHALVEKAIQYLLNSYDSERSVWPIIPPEVEEAPHAFWWGYAESEKNFGSFLTNPRAAILAHLYAFPDLVPEDFLTEVTQNVMAHLETQPDKLGLHDFLCWRDLSEAKHLPEQHKSLLLEKLLKVVSNIVAGDPEKWSEYLLKPLDAIPSPESALAQAVDPAGLQANLDWLIDQQLEDGAWGLAWDWKAVDEQAWAAAEREWKGYLAVRNLLILRSYGRLED